MFFPRRSRWERIAPLSPPAGRGAGGEGSRSKARGLPSVRPPSPRPSLPEDGGRGWPISGCSRSFRAAPACVFILISALCLLPSAYSQQDNAPLTIADLDAYRSALRPDEPDAPTPEPVSFADLWERPEQYLGRRVAIEGRAARRFRQPGIGEYPPLVELWIASRTGNPTCLVYPDPEGGDPTPLGATVRFVGTYQKRLEYQASDEPRLAPLVVGSEPPEILTAPAKGPWRPIGPFRGVDWMVGAIVAAAVVSAIVRQVLARPSPRRSRRDRAELEGPPPRFVDEPNAPYNDNGQGPDRPDGPLEPS